MIGIAYPAATDGADEITQLRARVRQLEKINSALMDRVERSIDMEGGAFSMFETAIALEAVVRDRTSALENAMSELNRVIAELAAANDDGDADQQTKDDQWQLVCLACALRCTGNGDHVVNAHDQIGHDDGLDRAPQFIAGLDVVVSAVVFGSQ